MVGVKVGVSIIKAVSGVVAVVVVMYTTCVATTRDVWPPPQCTLSSPAGGPEEGEGKDALRAACE